MRKTFHYYNCFITRNGEITDVHLSDMLDAIRGVTPRRRLKNLKQGNICLMDMRDPTENINDQTDRKVVFGIYRKNKPFLGNEGTERIDEILDDVLELTSIFYRRNSRLLIIEYNHYGVRPNGLQKYLESFLPVSEDDVWDIEFEPIEPQLGFEDIQQSGDIRKVDFRIDLTARNRRLYIDDQEEHRSVIGDILDSSIDTHEQFGANVAQIGFGNGRKRSVGGVIDSDSLVGLLRGLDFEGDIFESVKVKYKSPTTGKIEEIDVKNQGVLKEIIECEADGWAFICDTMENHFYNNGRNGENEFREYAIEAFQQLPTLLYND